MRRFRISSSLIILFIIFLLGTSARFIGLGKNPAGIVDDEADTAYDAYSLIHTGKDQWGVSLPITSLRGFGDSRLTGYTYTAVLSIAMFGLTPFAVRLPSAMFGSLTIVLVYWLVKELFGSSSDILPLLSAFFLAISPWHIGMSRIGLEETMSVFCITAALCLLLKGRKNAALVLIGSMLLGISFYVYTANIFLAPFLFITVLYCYRSQFKTFWTYSIAGMCIFCVMGIPILLAQSNSTIATRSRQVNFMNDSGVIDMVNEKQGSCDLVFPHNLCRVVINKYNTFGTKFISNYLNHFSPNLLSVYGTDTQYSILPGRGLLYIVDYALLMIGVIAVFVNPTSGGLFIIAFLLFSAFPDSLTSDGQFGRYFISYPTWPILFALAAVFIGHKMKKYRVVLFCMTVVYFLAFVNFTVQYWSVFPYQYSAYSHVGYADLINEIQSYGNAYDHIIVSSRVNDAKQYIYYLFYTTYDPALFQSGKGIEKIVESNGWVRVKRINAIEFLPTLPGYDELVNEHVLLIGAPQEFPKTIPNVVPPTAIPVEFTVKDMAGHILFEGVDSTKLYK